MELLKLVYYFKCILNYDWITKRGEIKEKSVTHFG